MERRDGRVEKGWGTNVAVLTVQYADGGKLCEKWPGTTAQWVTMFSANSGVLSLIPGIHTLKGRREPFPADCSLISTCMLWQMCKCVLAHSQDK